MEPDRVYDLSFLSKQKSISGVPEIRIHMEKNRVSSFITHLKSLLPQAQGYASEYLKVTDPEFSTVGRYGYARCCRVEGNTIALEVHDFAELQTDIEPGRALSLTLSLTLSALNALFGLEGTGKEKQLLQLDTNCRDTFHGHALYGWIFPAFGMWLDSKSKHLKNSMGDEIYVGRSFAPSARAAMQEVWKAVAIPELKDCTEECWAGLMRSGRFLLHCFGDACDAGIYPDQIGSRNVGDFMVEFSSHNVSNHIEQLTLAAGLAEMVSLAREENKKRWL